MKKNPEKNMERAEAIKPKKKKAPLKQRPSQKTNFFKCFKKKMIDEETSVSEIAKKLEKSRETIIRWMKDPTVVQFSNNILLMKTLNFTEKEIYEMVKLIVDELVE